MPRAPLLFTRLPFTCPTSPTCLHFLVCLTSPDLLRLLCALIFYLPSFFYVSCVASPFDVLTSLHFVRAFFFAYLRAFFTCSTCILFTCFRFSCIPSYFLRTFIFVKCFKFFTHITFLHFFYMHYVASIFLLNCQIKERRGTLIFLFFSTRSGVIRTYFGFFN